MADCAENLKSARIFALRAIKIEPLNYKPYWYYAGILRDMHVSYKESERYYLKALGMNNEIDELYASIGSGEITALSVIKKFIPNLIIYRFPNLMKIIKIQ